MTAIESEAELGRYQSLFGELWESAILRYSTLELPDGVLVPNGEIIFLEEAAEPTREILYSEGPFEIVEETKPTTFEFLRELIDGREVVGEGIEMTLCDHRVEQKFTNNPQARVQHDRPRTELHMALAPELTSDQKDHYSQTAGNLENRLQRSAEPYFDLSRCEYHYFEHHFRNKSKAEPEVLVFAPTGIDLDIDDDEKITVSIPKEIEEQTALSILPQRPYGVAKGQRIELATESATDREDGQLEYNITPELEEVRQIFVLLFVGEEMVRFEDHYSAPGDGSGAVNPRYQLFDEYDQQDRFIGHLQGEEDEFELAVLNVFSTAGYIVQTFGDNDFKIPEYDRENYDVEYDEVDLLAYRPDGSQILFIECTKKRISDKRDLLDRMEFIGSTLDSPESEDQYEAREYERNFIPIIATPQSSNEINDQVVKDLTESGIIILNGERLTEIYKRSRNQTDSVKIDFNERGRM